jgi:tripartite ATP-independent transporter DctP family solute receptor
MRHSTRRQFAAMTAAVTAAGPLLAPRRSRAADMSFKFATNLPAQHPLNVRAQQAIDQIAKQTNGAVEIRLFPSSQLGTDTDMLSQVRSGGIDFFTLSGLILSTLVPIASINGIGFAFASYDQVWPAMDGALGGLVRSEITKRGLIAMDRIWDNGFRQITTSVRPITAPGDLRGLKLRVPVSPLWTSLFVALGASPASINISETYSALQTHIVDGQENPLAVIETTKMYEVQKYCSMTNHMWDGYWLLANRRMFEKLPKDVADIMTTAFNAAALDQRRDVAALNGGLQGTLAKDGMVFNAVDAAPFRQTLRDAGFYKDWRARYGEEAWHVLETAVGTTLA